MLLFDITGNHLVSLPIYNVTNYPKSYLDHKCPFRKVKKIVQYKVVSEGKCYHEHALSQSSW